MQKIVTFSEPLVIMLIFIIGFLVIIPSVIPNTSPFGVFVSAL